MMEKLEITINEMMADTDQYQWTRDMLWTRATTCHTTSLGKGTEPAREQARKDRTGQECGIVEKELRIDERQKK